MDLPWKPSLYRTATAESTAANTINTGCTILVACQKYHLKLENSSFWYNHFKIIRKIRQAADIEISTIYPTPRLENLCIFWSHVCVEQPDKVEPMTTLVLYSDIEPYMGRHSRMTMIRRKGGRYAPFA